MKKFKLLASSPDLAGLILRIQDYWFSKSINLVDAGNQTFDVYNNEKLISGFRVIYKSNRYRFEGSLV